MGVTVEPVCRGSAGLPQVAEGQDVPGDVTSWPEHGHMDTPGARGAPWQEVHVEDLRTGQPGPDAGGSD